MMRSMGRASRLALATLFLAAGAARLGAAPPREEAGHGGHCANMPGTSHAHAQREARSGDLLSDAGAHGCTECESPHCPATAHCASTGALALLPGEPVMAASPPAAAGYDRVDDEARSVNPTPPIPPPQPVL